MCQVLCIVLVVLYVVGCVGLVCLDEFVEVDIDGGDDDDCFVYEFFFCGSIVMSGSVLCVVVMVVDLCCDRVGDCV